MNLIVGIDPGVTVGLALLDLNGQIVSIVSGKNISLNDLIALTLKYGNALIVGCDKSKAPNLITSYGAKFNARIIVTETDLKFKEKLNLIKKYEDFKKLDLKNEHEFDALAAALFAYKKIKPLLIRAFKTLKNLKKLEYFDKVVEIVVKQKISILDALKILKI